MVIDLLSTYLLEDGKHLWSHIPHVDSCSTEAVAVCEIMSERLSSKVVVVVRKGSTYVCIRLAFPRRIPVRVLGVSSR